jgi:pilus assembly protein Flp/PilA
MHKLTISLRKFFENKEGATMVEYGLMVALIAVVCLTAVSLLGTNLRDIFNQIAAAV